MQELLSLVCHELRTPVTSVMGYLDLVLEDEDSPPERQREYLRRAQTNVAFLADLLRSIHELAYLEQGRVPLSLQRIPLEPFVREMADAFGCRAECEKLEILIEVARPRLSVVGDRALLTRVLTTLLCNACRYTESGGFVTVRIRPDASGAAIEVADTGVGIPEDEQDRVFTPFYRGSNTRSVRPRGAGLGLAIAKRQMEFMGGTLRFASRPGDGSVFMMCLPTTAGRGRLVEAPPTRHALDS